MYFITFLILLIKFSSTSVECIQQAEFVTIKEAPYYASLVSGTKSDKDGMCGASILTEYWIVTAGHCAKDGEWLKVRTGATSNYGDGTIYTIDHVVLPDNYSLHSSYLFHVNDIGLIKLKKPIKFNEYQQPIKLRSRPPKENDTVITYGLGYERVLNTPPSLKKTVNLVASKSPSNLFNVPEVFHLQNSTSHLCPGDSGSPGVIDNELAGVHIFGTERCKNWNTSHLMEYPGAFTRIDIFYNWILNHTGIEY